MAEKMVHVVGPNVIRDKEFRRRLNLSSTSGDEAAQVMKQVLEAHKDQLHTLQDGEMSRIIRMQSSESEPLNQDVEIKAKLFLPEFDHDAAAKAVRAVLKTIGADQLDSLQLSVPVCSLQTLAIAQEAKDKNEAYEADLGRLIELWKSLESLESLKSMGLCDVETQTLERLFAAVDRKPQIVTLNLASCCVVPSDMQKFATSNNIKLATHNDPEIILSDEILLGKDYPIVEEDSKIKFVIRYQIMDPARGVLKDKRYVIGIGK